MTRHPFELELSELEAINLEIEDLTEEQAQEVTGGCPGMVTQVNDKEGGGRFTTLALGEEGGDVTTLALGEEG
ncbi:MAG: hypothetical protein QNJ42_24335 [Crocosphaera sp.]|nr:hypothetical protein [Crocosphaera sp.]